MPMIYNELDWKGLDNVICDVAILGSGPAGIALAKSLESKGFSICIFEGGNDEYDEKSQELYAGEIVGRALPYGLMYSRMRQFGGSSNCWGSGCGILEDQDFIYRDWVSNSGWPIGFDDIKEYYKEASNFLKLPDITEQRNNSHDVLVGFDNPSLYYTPIGNFKDEFGESLKKSKKIKIFLSANFKSFSESEPGVVNKLELIGLNQSSIIKCDAKIFVLACGGIENSRILLNTRNSPSNAIGNDNDLVGRFFCDHPITPVASVIAPNLGRLESLDRSQYVKSYEKQEVLSIPYFKIPDKEQKKREILNCCVSFQKDFSPLSPAAVSAWSLLRAWKEKGISGLNKNDLVNVITNPTDVINGLYERKFGGSRYAMRIQMEQEPNYSSRLKLGKEKDSFGHYKSVLDWKFSDLDRHTIDEAIKYSSDIFIKNEFGLLKLDETISEQKNMPLDLRGGQHHSGTTRMGESKKIGVVDKNLKVFETKNLYVNGSSVFPTNGWVNPTFTIIALSFRLSNQIEKVLNA
jgi:hypothetical protein